MQTYIVEKSNDRITAALLDEKCKPIELHVDPLQNEVQTGDILIGRVMQVVWNIHAAFVDIGIGRNCYLPIDERITPFYTKKGASSRIQQGDELIVQVERPAMKTKAPALSAALTLKGRYLLVGTKSQEAGVSRKIAEPRRTELKDLAAELIASVTDASEEGQTGSFPHLNVLMRTNAAAAEETVIREEFASLYARLCQLTERARFLSSGTRLYDAGALWLKHLIDLSEEYTEKILIEDEEMYLQAEEFLTLQHPELLHCLERYEDPLWPIGKKYEIAEMVKEASHRRVWMRSGAYLVIEPTEALTCIDVNSGKIGPGKPKSERQETFLKVNLEAAKEIARQIRLRNISGIIIADFINLEQEEHRQQLMEYFGTCLAKDPIPSRVVDMTKLGLIEVTRKKTEQALETERE